MAIPPIKKFTEDCWGFAPRWSILYTILRISSFGIPISNLWGCSCTRWPSNTIRQYQTTIGVYHLDVAFYTQFFWLFPGPQSIEHCIFNLCINSVPIMLWLWGAYVASQGWTCTRGVSWLWPASCCGTCCHLWHQGENRSVDWRRVPANSQVRHGTTSSQLLSPLLPCACRNVPHGPPFREACLRWP